MTDAQFRVFAFGADSRTSHDAAYDAVIFPRMPRTADARAGLLSPAAAALKQGGFGGNFALVDEDGATTAPAWLSRNYSAPRRGAS